MDNDSGTSNIKSPVFNMESEWFELDTNAAETRSSCVDNCCLDDIFNSAGSDVSEDESPEFHQNDQGFETTELNYKTMTCLIDVKGIVKSCVPIEEKEFDTEKIEDLATDIDTIENRLRSFLGDHFYYHDFDTRDQILCTIDLIKKDISKLDDYWNGHYLVIEELNRQINELNHSNTRLCHMNQEVADLYSIYVDTKFRQVYLYSIRHQRFFF
ncbi:uncharacterized protein LOC132934212 [Metopolophium dirhodum]|uniref:uncharacterized protein LOC132934212 n=1 Tax=Metopolophium dirhodum TaxID=44670 RepID=UPI0029903788|nr:uncharacterized protein LOC132934212 [Metopolophium dirhodum]